MRRWIRSQGCCQRVSVTAGSSDPYADVRWCLSLIRASDEAVEARSAPRRPAGYSPVCRPGSWLSWVHSGRSNVPWVHHFNYSRTPGDISILTCLPNGRFTPVMMMLTISVAGLHQSIT